MLLLYPNRMVSEENGFKCIYIPLCFYFIKMRIRFVLPVSRYLHSIMLLLYRLCFHLSCAQFHIFTFHYASTLSRRGKESEVHEKEFTFHYASTLSNTLLIIRSGQLHLHSIMLLLYRSLRKMIENANNKFTFHYASTLSPGSC